ncbi:hypothetical protein [Nostoc cycadae]|nr:hypothetical protein [Nostoc cycadae]
MQFPRQVYQREYQNARLKPDILSPAIEQKCFATAQTMLNTGD